MLLPHLHFISGLSCTDTTCVLTQCLPCRPRTEKSGFKRETTGNIWSDIWDSGEGYAERGHYPEDWEA